MSTYSLVEQGHAICTRGYNSKSKETFNAVSQHPVALDINIYFKCVDIMT
jgi:hypothetical protein